jgi:hypothetical protein
MYIFLCKKGNTRMYIFESIRSILKESLGAQVGIKICAAY